MFGQFISGLAMTLVGGFIYAIVMGMSGLLDSNQINKYVRLATLFLPGVAVTVLEFFSPAVGQPTTLFFGWLAGIVWAVLTTLLFNVTELDESVHPYVRLGISFWLPILFLFVAWTVPPVILPAE